MKRTSFKICLIILLILPGNINSQEISINGIPSRLSVYTAGENSLRIVLMPVSQSEEFPFSPALEVRDYLDPLVSLSKITRHETVKAGRFNIILSPDPLTIEVSRQNGELLQSLSFAEDGTMNFLVDESPLLGMGEGGPRMGQGWREEAIEFDRRGRIHAMVPRWQANAYGSRNPVPLMIGTSGWALFVATPWGEVDLTKSDRGTYLPWTPPGVRSDSIDGNITRMLQGRPPVESILPGVYDIFMFDASDPALFMKELSIITGEAVMPPRWALGYMQSHRTLEDDKQMIDVVDTFREKRIPVDAVIYLGTGFCPRGWNTEQPSFDFNPEVFRRDPRDVISDLHERNVRVVTHIVPWRRDRLPTLSGNIPALPGELVDNSHIQDYWLQHTDLVKSGIDAWWPDEGDWFNLFERVKRHQLYYQGPLLTSPDTRPWSLHRNGYLGIAKWGGWVWSGDTDSSWKTLEGQVATGINHSLSLSPYWGSDIGGFYPNEELTGELYARWFQFGAFCPSFRSHGRTWWTRLPWGWGLGEMGPVENRSNPLASELNNPEIESVCRIYDNLRYSLLPYNYTLAWEARSNGMPFMRALWLHYPDDIIARSKGDQYLWGRDLMIAPVYEKGAVSRELYLPEGTWYDWWTGESKQGGAELKRSVDLGVMPIYVRAGAIIPLDPVRQYTAEEVGEPMTLRIYPGADGEYLLYEDDGETQQYLQGKYLLTRFLWNDKKRRLTIEPLKEGKMESPAGRKLIITLISDNASREIACTGKRQVVKF